MDNKDLEQYSQNIIQQNQPLFNQIKQISDDLLIHTDVSNIQKYYEYQDKLTGIYGSLNPIYKRVRSYKKNKEVEYYHKLKMEADINHTKFMSAAAERESSLYVSPLRTSKDILEGYVEVLVTAINTCRSRIYEHRKDEKYEV